MTKQLPLITCLTMLLLLLSPVSHGQLYKWVDENGKVHYGDSPPENVKLKTITGKVTLSADVKDELGVAEVEFRVDGKLVGRTLTKPPYSVPWDASSVRRGTHTLTVTAKDVEGNESKKTVRVKTR